MPNRINTKFGLDCVQRFLFLLFAISSLSFLFSSCSVNRRLKKADKKYEIGEYFAASDMYKKLQNSVSKKDKKKKAEVAFKLGECYRLTNNDAKALRAYSNVVKWNPENDTAYLRCAEMQRALGRYGEASKSYARFLKKNPESRLALAGKMACDSALFWKKNPTRYVVKFASGFNSKRNSDFSPSFMGSGESLVFTSNRDSKLSKKNSAITGQPNNNIYFTKKNAEGKWDDLSLMEGEFNTINDEGTPFCSLDGKKFFFTRCRYVKGSNLGAEIYLSKRSGGQWSEPKKIEIFKDSSITVAHPALSVDGKYLYFVSDAENGQGGKDLWRCEIKGDDFGMAENLGSQINTEGDEMFPSFDSRGNLYFSSDGHVGFGGLDIFKAVCDTSGNWTVENMKAPINSSADDFGITFENGQIQRGFFSSNRNQKKGFDKIWSFELPEVLFSVEGKIMDQNNESITDAVIKIIGNKGTNVKLKARKDGTYRINLKKDEDYVILATARGFLNMSNKFTTSQLNNSKVFQQDFQLISLRKPVQMENIFYEFGKWELTEESKKSLSGLVKLLNDNPNITIEISAHTDSRGTEGFNLELSQKRAQSVVDFLIQSDIEKERLTPKGYGKSTPVVVTKQLARKHNFLRENDILNEKLYNHLTEAQKEIVDQINRRTEFKVLTTTYNLF